MHTPSTSALLRRAIEEIRALKARLPADAGNDPIAVIGMANRFPGGADNPEDFWDRLRRGQDLTGSRGSERGGFLSAVDEFDAVFFGISPLEAPLIDPQHRLLLEVSWQALEDALIPDSIVRQVPVGLFAGISQDDYAQLTLRSGQASEVAGPAALGSARSMGPGRAAYFLGLTGPVMQVDTSCSSSLVAVHLACQSLRSGECEMALAGGVNLVLTKDMDEALEHLGALAPDGRCKTFDARADGYVRGEGCGIVVLRRLSAALESGDRIRGVIAGSAVNHDGRSNGLTAPNGSAQVALIERALRMANLKPEDIQYIEAHGTGTSLGDPVELMALARALGERRDGDLHVGSVKSNIGHLESAAGIAGLIKAVLMVEHGEIPPSLHVEQLNPHFDWQKYPFRVPRETLAWPEGEKQRAAGVSAFGMSGTNAHAIVTSPPRVERIADRKDWRPHILCLSARSEWAALELKRQFAEQVAGTDDQKYLADYCYSTRVGRSAWPFRISVTGGDGRALADALAMATPRECRRQATVGFRLHSGGDADLTDQLSAEPALRRIFELCRTQPVYALQCGLGDLWKSWGIEPVAIAADAASEAAAQYLRGEISLEEGLAQAAAPREGLSPSSEVEADVVIEIGRPRIQVPRGSVPSLIPGRTAGESVAAAVAEVWSAGAEFDWTSFDAGYGRRRIALPHYPFQKKKYWADLRIKKEEAKNSAPAGPSETQAAALPVVMLRDRLAGLTPAVRRREALEHVGKVVAEKLGYPPSATPPIREGFFQIGMDSLAATKILDALRSSTGFPLSPTDLFVYSTIEDLTEYILTSMFPGSGNSNTDQRALVARARVDTETQQSALLNVIEEVETLLRTRT